MQLIITFTLLVVTIFLFILNRFRGDLIAIMALLAFVTLGILTPQEALEGFSNSVVIMIAGLFIIGTGLMRTGLSGMAGRLLLKWSGNSELKLFVLLLLIVAVVGAFMSNTGTVALMMPIVVSIALSIQVSPSKYLLPLSYMASMSGLMTLIASPPNLIVSQTLVDYGFDKLGFFAITPIGMIAAVVVILYLVFVRNKLLPNKNKGISSNNAYQLSPEKIVEEYHLNDKLFKVYVPMNSKIVGKSLAELKLPSTFNVYVMKILKHTEGPKVFSYPHQMVAGPRSIIHARDVLYVQGEQEDVYHFVKDCGLVVREFDREESNELVSKDIGVAEVLLTPHSRLIGKKVGEIGFREKYDVNIIGINRKGEYFTENIASQRLRFGDAILVQGTWDAIEFLSKETQDVVVVGQPKEMAGHIAATGKAKIAAAILLFMVALMVFEVFDAVICVLIGAVLMIITGCLRNVDDAYDQMNFESIVLVAAMLPMATALEKTGGMTLLADGIIHVLGGFGSFGVLVGVYLLTIVFGQFISNTATAVLFAPIAMNAALTMDANPYTFMIAVAAASGMAFATPIASPTNSLVLTVGGYTFTDFLKIGIPLQLIMFIVMMYVIPFIFPL